jgi:hypothetical protein
MIQTGLLSSSLERGAEGEKAGYFAPLAFRCGKNQKQEAPLIQMSNSINSGIVKMEGVK